MRERVSHLYAVLPEGEASTIRQIIQTCKGLLRLSASGFFQELQLKGMNSPIFKPMRDYLVLVENVRSQTYSVGGDITIGIGLDLTVNKNHAKALFYAVDPNRNWDYETLFSQTGKPVPALTDTQINQLLYYSIVGVSNKEGSFTGYAQGLVTALGNLASMPLEIYQLIGLLSMVFNGGRGILGSYMLKALQDMKSINNDLEPLQQIIEYSNGGHNVGLQNRRLQDAAVFHGNSTDSKLDVHLTWRQYQRILASAKDTISLIGGPVKWGIPKGNDQENFEGYPSVVDFPSGSANYDEPTYFGTPKNDDLTYSMQSFGSPVFYGGDGNDTFGISFGQTTFINKRNSLQSDFAWNPYFAGGKGYDIYNISGIESNIFIYDSDAHGGIIFPAYLADNCIINTNLRLYLSGPIIDNQLISCPEVVNAVFQREEDKSQTLKLYNTDFASSQISVGNFKTLQFGILPGGYSKNLYIDPNPYQEYSAVSTTGKIVLASLDSNVQLNYNFAVYDINLKILNKFTINSFLQLNSANFIPTYSDGFYASGIQQYSSNDTLLGLIIDGSASEYTLSPIAIQQHTNCSQTCNYFEFSYSIPLTTGNIATIACIESEINFKTISCSLASYIDGVQTVINTINSPNCNCISNYTNLAGWPIHKGGFFLTYSPLGSNINIVALCNTNGAPYQRYNINNVQISSVGFIDDGYLMALTDKATTKLYVRMYRESRGWLPDFILSSNFILQPNTFMQLLPNNKILFFVHGVYLFGFILNSDNSNFAGPFSLINSSGIISNWGMGSVQENGDTIIFSYNFDGDRNYLQSIFLPTSQFHQELNSIEKNQNIVEKTPLTEKQIASSSIKIIEEVSNNNHHNHSRSYSKLPFMAGAWDNATKQDPNTGKPIFTYHLYNENNTEIGSAEFYAHPLLCFSEDKQRHNIIKTTGVLNELNIMDMMSVDEVCEVLPPTLFDKVITSTTNAAIHGGLRGGSNVVGYTLNTAFGISKDISYYVSQFLYYGSYFTMQFSVYCQQMEQQNDASRCLNALYYAVLDTGQILVSNVVLNTVGELLQKAGESLENNNWSLLGKAFKVGGSIMRFGIFACNAADRGIIPATAALFAGTVTEIGIEESGEESWKARSAEMTSPR